MEGRSRGGAGCKKEVERWSKLRSGKRWEGKGGAGRRE